MEKIHFEDRIEFAAKSLCRSGRGLALTGAGISVESGIPDFRSSEGLWERFDIMEYGTISAFRKNPEKVWKMLTEMEVVIRRASPNPAHKGLGKLERLDIIHAVITQNIDNLHQEGGSKNIIEYHGNSKTFSCLECGRKYGLEAIGNLVPPKCKCGQILKPDIVFFGESIPQEALFESYRLASECHTLLVVGTSASVVPANAIPGTAKRSGARIIEINIEPTLLTTSLTDVFLQGKAGTVVPRLVKKVESLLANKTLS